MRWTLVAVACTTIATAAQGPAAPATLRTDSTSPFRLGARTDVAFTVSLPPGETAIVLDSRRADAKAGRLQARVGVSDVAGNVLLAEAEVTDLSEVEHRSVQRVTSTRVRDVVIRVSNPGEGAVQQWLTVSTDPQRLVPLFGDTYPLATTDGAATGRLDKNEHAYLLMPLAAGTYRVSVEFSNPNRYATPLAGAVSLLDAQGGLLQRLTVIDAQNVAHTESATFAVARGGRYIVKVFNAGGPTNDYYRTDFVVRVVPDRP